MMIYLVIIHFPKERSHNNDRWGGDERKKTTQEGISSGFPKHTERERERNVIVYFVTPLPVVWQLRNLLRGNDEMKMSVKAVWDMRDFLSFPVLPCLSVCLYLLPAYLPCCLWWCDKAAKQIYPAITYAQAINDGRVCNRTIPQFIFHIIVSPLLACHGGSCVMGVVMTGVR